MSKRVADTVFDELRKGGATRRELLAAGVTGLAESNFENLPGGDRDSEGWRQERKQFYSNPRNVRAAARRFLSEAKAFRGKKMTVGQLAQAVQQSGVPGAYQPRLAEAKRLLGDSPRGTGDGRAPRTETVPGEMVTDKLGALRSALLSGQKNVLLNADRMIASGAYTSQAPDRQRKIAGQFEGSAPSGRGATRGNVKVSPGANRKGKGLSSDLLDTVESIAGVFGSTLTIGTGTQHSQMTTSGNVSDHWDGNGADIPALGKRLTRMGQAALIAAGMPEKEARRKTGGVFNMHKGGKRIQILFNTKTGGNHYNHLHVGVG